MPTTSVPPPVRPSRKRLVRLAAVAAAILGLLGWVCTGSLERAVRGVGKWAAGVGAMEWRSPHGTWTAVAPADAARRLWGPVDAFLAVDWATLAPGLELGVVPIRRPPNPHAVDVVVARVAPAEWRFRVWGRDDWRAGAVDELAAEAGLALAVNASYFAEDGPIGLVVSDGVRRQRQARSRAAHFLVGRDGAPRIVNQKGASLSGVTQGFQGFPSIMSNGRTFSYMRAGGRGFDVWKVDRRTAACVDREGRVLLLATDTVTNGLSLEELATVLGGLGCVDAMGFDGGGSTGMAIRVGDAARGFGNLEAVPVVLGIEAR